jgi:hypothetical protein
MFVNTTSQQLKDKPLPVDFFMYFKLGKYSVFAESSLYPYFMDTLVYAVVCISKELGFSVERTQAGVVDITLLNGSAQTTLLVIEVKDQIALPLKNSLLLYDSRRAERQASAKPVVKSADEKHIEQVFGYLISTGG